MPKVEVVYLATDSENVYHGMLTVVFDSGQKEHVINLTTDDDGYTVLIANSVNGRSYIKHSVYNLMQIDPLDGDKIDQIQQIVKEMFMDWKFEIDEDLKVGKAPSLSIEVKTEIAA